MFFFVLLEAIPLAVAAFEGGLMVLRVLERSTFQAVDHPVSLRYLLLSREERGDLLGLVNQPAFQLWAQGAPLRARLASARGLLARAKGTQTEPLALQVVQGLEGMLQSLEIPREVEGRILKALRGLEGADRRNRKRLGKKARGDLLCQEQARFKGQPGELAN